LCSCGSNKSPGWENKGEACDSGTGARQGLTSPPGEARGGGLEPLGVD